MAYNSSLEPAIRKIFQETLRDTLGWDPPNMHLQIMSSSLSSHLECRATWKYDCREYANIINIPYNDIEYGVVTYKVKALAKATAKIVQNYALGNISDAARYNVWVVDDVGCKKPDELQIAIENAVQELK